MFEFQVNYKLSVKELNRKPNEENGDFKLNIKKHWQRYQDFDSVEQGLETLIKQLSDGYTIRYGIKEKSNRIQDFECSYGTALDLDCHTQEELDLALESDITQQAFYGHPSYSYNGIDHFGYRLHFRYSRPITDVTEARILNYSLMLELKPEYIDWFESRDTVNLQGLDAQCNDAARIWYSGNPEKLTQHSHLIIVRLDREVNVEAHLSQIDECVKDHVTKSKKGVITTPLDSDSIPSLTDLGVSEESLLHRFCNHLDTFLTPKNEAETDDQILVEWVQRYLESKERKALNWHLHGSPGDALWQYRAADPLDENANERSDSFCFSKMPDGSYIWKSGKFNASGDITTLLYTIFSQSDIYRTSGLKPQDRKNACDHFLRFCRFEELPNLEKVEQGDQKKKNKKQSYEATESDQKVLDSVSFIYFNDKGITCINPNSAFNYFIEENQDRYYEVDLAGTHFYYYSCLNSIGKVWRWDKLNMFGMVRSVIRFCCDRFPYVPVKGNSDTMVLTESLFKAQHKAEIKNRLENQSSDYLVRQKTILERYVPFANCVYDTVTKQTLPYPHKEAWNFINDDIEYKPSTGKGIVALRKLLAKVLDYPEPILESAIDDIVLWIAAITQYKGYDTTKALWLVGSSNSGKTFFTGLISELVQSDAGYHSYQIIGNTSIKKLIDEESRFNDQLSSKVLVQITESSGIPKGEDGSNLKDAIANQDDRGYLVQSEEKFVQGVSTLYIKPAFIFNSQEMPKIPKNGDMGFHRRLMMVKFRERAYEKEMEDLFCVLFPHHTLNGSRPVEFQLESRETFQDLKCWLVEQDITEGVRRLSKKGYCPEWMMIGRVQLDQENSPISRWIKSYLVYDVEAVGIAPKELYETFTEWCRNNNKYTQEEQAFYKEFAQKLTLTLETIKNISEVKKRTRKGMIYQGIRLKRVEEMHDDYEHDQD